MCATLEHAIGVGAVDVCMDGMAKAIPRPHLHFFLILDPHGLKLMIIRHVDLDVPLSAFFESPLDVEKVDRWTHWRSWKL